MYEIEFYTSILRIITAQASSASRRQILTSERMEFAARFWRWHTNFDIWVADFQIDNPPSWDDK
jgi:hypothetical protein